VVAAISHSSDPVIALPEANGRKSVDELLKLGYELFIIFLFVLILISASAYTYFRACLTMTNSMISHHDNHVAFIIRP
jgi:hypothetical protein